jgi:hypothetical protein
MGFVRFSGFFYTFFGALFLGNKGRSGRGAILSFVVVVN